MKTLKQEIILLGDQTNPWLIEGLTKGLIILEIVEQCKSQEQLNQVIQMLSTCAMASMDTMGEIYAILYSCASLTSRGKYNDLDEIEVTFKIPNVRLEFMSIIDKFKLRKK